AERDRRGARRRIPRAGAARGLRAARDRHAEEARASARAARVGWPDGIVRGEHAHRARQGERLLKARLLEWWTGLSRRERIATTAAAVLVTVATLYLAAIEPAWRARVRLAAELPQLRAQVAEMDALAIEAKKLNSRAPGVDSPGQAKAA